MICRSVTTEGPLNSPGFCCFSATRAPGGRLNLLTPSVRPRSTLRGCPGNCCLFREYPKASIGPRSPLPTSNAKASLWNAANGTALHVSRITFSDGAPRLVQYRSLAVGRILSCYLRPGPVWTPGSKATHVRTAVARRTLPPPIATLPPPVPLTWCS